VSRVSRKIRKDVQGKSERVFREYQECFLREKRIHRPLCRHHRSPAKQSCHPIPMVARTSFGTYRGAT
jgi:hypothetical protein